MAFVTDSATPAASPPATPPAVRLQGLTKSFGSVRAVRGIDLTVAPGEIVAVLGPNGAGKSTTNEMILGLVSPDAGAVEVFGQPPRAAVRQGRVGAMLQHGPLLGDTTVQDLVRLLHGLHVHPLPFGEVIERSDIAGFLSTKTDRLSGGQAQRVRYALAIMPDPDLLILDEPTVGMDVETRLRFWRSMRDLVGGEDRTVLFATHYLTEADDVSDRIVVLADGAVRADGTGAQIKGLVAGRTVSLDAESVSRSVASGLPGVVSSDRQGARLLLHTNDSDTLLRHLLRAEPDARDIEVTSANLEDAFLSLTRASGRGTDPEED